MVKVKTHRIDPVLSRVPSITHETDGVCNTSSIDHKSGCVSNSSGIKCSNRGSNVSRGNTMDGLLHNTLVERGHILLR